MTEDQCDQLRTAALAARQRAYAPYSRFQVGAAILLHDGRIISGCNVENASYGLCICAERNAATTMVTEGATRIAAVAVATVGGVSPCGACRQFLAEFGTHFPVILIEATTGNIVGRHTMKDLLPFAFDSSQLPE